MEPNKTAMYYWVHLDTLNSSDAHQPARKKRKQEVEEGRSSDDTEGDEEETKDLEGQSGEEGFQMAPHNVDLDEVEEVEGVEVQPKGGEEVERPAT